MEHVIFWKWCRATHYYILSLIMAASPISFLPSTKMRPRACRAALNKQHLSTLNSSFTPNFLFLFAQNCIVSLFVAKTCLHYTYSSLLPPPWTSSKSVEFGGEPPLWQLKWKYSIFLKNNDKKIGLGQTLQSSSLIHIFT